MLDEEDVGFPDIVVMSQPIDAVPLPATEDCIPVIPSDLLLPPPVSVGEPQVNPFLMH